MHAFSARRNAFPIAACASPLLEYTPVDLNGVQPWAALAGGVLYTAFAIGAWRATTIAAEWFTANPAPSDVYVAQVRASGWLNAWIDWSACCLAVVG